MFVEVDQDTGLPAKEETSRCVHSVAEMEAQGFRLIEVARGILCTEVHYNGPFHLEFADASIQADAIESDYLGVKSTHRVVLSGGLPGDKVAFQAIAD
jgi:hypothetical protein